MTYYTRSYDPQPTTRVTSSELKNEFQSVENGLAAAETDVGKCIRAPEATTAVPNAVSRALKVLSFDASGNPRTTIAETDLTAAVTAASNAAASASAASTSASNASDSASAAFGSATSASGSAATATTQAGIATTQAGTATTQASTATTQAGIATTQAGIATTQAGIATTQAGNASASASAASTSAGNAATSASNAATSANNAANSFDAFDDRYLGSKASDPTLDNDGNALLTGALYWNSSSNVMRVWNGSAWQNTAALSSGDVAGPASSTDNTLPRYDGTTGKLLQGSGVVVDDSGNVGFGAAPSNASASARSLEFGQRGVMWASTSAGFTSYGTNATLESSGNWSYKNTGVARAYVQSDTGHEWRSAASGTAGTVITFVTHMTLDASGRLGINATPAARLDVSGNTAINVVAVAALDIDCSAGNYFTKTIAGNSTFTFSNVPASRAFAFTLELTHTSGTVTWPAAVQWPGQTAPTLTTGRTHLFTFVTDDGGSRWRGVANTNYTT